MQIANAARLWLLSAVAITLGVGSAGAQQTIVKDNADAEIRETQPEFTRGNPDPPASGSSTQKDELQISSNPANSGVNRNLALVRFHVPDTITSGADLQNYAELRLFFRHQNMNGNGSLRLYGLAPTNPLNTSWDETNVMYRDTGTHYNPNPVIGSGQSNTNSASAQPAYPTPPILGTPSGGIDYGADPNHARRAPGLIYENAPYSVQVDNENQARFTYNQTHSPALPYINQPGYNIAKTGTQAVPTAISVGDGDPTTTADGYADIYNDVPESNRPFFSGPTDTYLDDLDTGATGVTLIGYATVNFPGSASYVGQYITFGATTPAGAGLASTNTPQADADAANAALVAFLTHWLDDPNHYHDFTFIVGQGIADANEVGTPLPDPNNAINLQLASRDYTPQTSGGTIIGALGDYAPQLVLAPEPGSIALLAMGALPLVRRRRK